MEVRTDNPSDLASLGHPAALRKYAGGKGDPAEAQRSGFGGERSRSGMNDTCRLRRGERYAACGDEA